MGDWSDAACIQMLNSVPQDLVAPQQGDPQEQDPHIYQLLLYKPALTSSLTG